MTKIVFKHLTCNITPLNNGYIKSISLEEYTKHELQNADSQHEIICIAYFKKDVSYL